MEKKKVASKWLSGIETPEEFEKKLLEQKVLFQRLFKLVEEKEKANTDSSLKKANYDSGSWSHFIADSIGYARALEEIKFLLKFTQD